MIYKVADGMHFDGQRTEVIRVCALTALTRLGSKASARECNAGIHHLTSILDNHRLLRALFGRNGRKQSLARVRDQLLGDRFLLRCLGAPNHQAAVPLHPIAPLDQPSSEL